jgi:transcriptional regulator with XRE-family HTH domain
MTAAHINQLAIGKQPHPRIHHVEALASFFGVPVTYFVDDDAAAQIADQIAQVSAWRDTEARHIAERVVQLNPRDRNTVTNLIDTLRAYDEQPRLSRRRRKPSTSDGA